MVQLADIRPGMTVLEPSAGRGDIADEVAALGTRVNVIEPNRVRIKCLLQKGHNLVGNDFMVHTKSYDRILMNPPFSKGQAGRHVQHAYKLLNPLGRLVSVMPTHYFDRPTHLQRTFLSWLEKKPHSIIRLEKDSFACSSHPNGIENLVLVIDKGSKSPR
jgi:hypothetical protein